MAVVVSLAVGERSALGVPPDASAVVDEFRREEIQIERSKLELEQNKYQLRQRKLAFEEKKLKLEAQQNALSTQPWALVYVTALTALGTIIYNVRNVNYQAKVQARLKALEVIMAAPGPKSAGKRLSIVKELLGPGLIDKGLAEELVIEGVGLGYDQSRKELIKMLLEFPEHRDEVFLLWQIAFGKTSLEPNITAMQNALTLKEEAGGQPSASSGQPASPSAR